MSQNNFFRINVHRIIVCLTVCENSNSNNICGQVIQLVCLVSNPGNCPFSSLAFFLLLTAYPLMMQYPMYTLITISIMNSITPITALVEIPVEYYNKSSINNTKELINQLLRQECGPSRKLSSQNYKNIHFHI